MYFLLDSYRLVSIWIEIIVLYEHPFLAPSFLYRSKLEIRLLNREKLFNTEAHVFLPVSRKIFIVFDAIIATVSYILVRADDEFICAS